MKMSTDIEKFQICFSVKIVIVSYITKLTGIEVNMDGSGFTIMSRNKDIAIYSK
jgi:hypothetical protein